MPACFFAAIAMVALSLRYARYVVDVDATPRHHVEYARLSAI